MANPFDTIGPQSNDFYQNLMQFGLATMAAGAQPGARTLGALGQGGLAAMQSSRENALARTQNQLYGAEAQSKLMGNAVSMNQINMQRMGMGLPPLDIPGMGGQQGTQSAATPAVNNTGMPNSPTPGRQLTVSPSASPSPQTMPGGGFDQTRLSAIGSGRLQPADAAEAAAAAPWAHMMGFADRAKELNTYALAAPIEGTKLTPIAPGGSVYQNGRIVATGAQDGKTLEGKGYRIPARAMPTGEQPYTPDPAATTGNLWGSAPPQAGQQDFVTTLANKSPAMSGGNIPTGALLTDISPSNQEELKASGKELGERQSEIRMKARLTPTINSNIDMMLAASKNSPHGPLAEDITEWRKWIQATTGVPEATADKIKDAETVQKVGMQLLGDYTKQVMQGSRIAFNEFPLFQKALPNIENSEKGLSQLGHLVQGTADYNLALERAMNAHVANPANGGSINNFDEGKFADQISPMAFQMARMNEEERAGLLNNLQKSMQGRRLAQSLSKQIKFGVENNLFQR